MYKLKAHNEMYTLVSAGLLLLPSIIGIENQTEEHTTIPCVYDTKHQKEIQQRNKRRMLQFRPCTYIVYVWAGVL